MQGVQRWQLRVGEESEFLLADALVERGARHLPAPNFTEQVVTDGRLVTGQNPPSAHTAATEVAKLLV